MGKWCIHCSWSAKSWCTNVRCEEGKWLWSTANSSQEFTSAYRVSVRRPHLSCTRKCDSYPPPVLDRQNHIVHHILLPVTILMMVQANYTDSKFEHDESDSNSTDENDESRQWKCNWCANTCYLLGQQRQCQLGIQFQHLVAVSEQDHLNGLVVDSISCHRLLSITWKLIISAICHLMSQANTD